MKTALDQLIADEERAQKRRKELNKPKKKVQKSPKKKKPDLNTEIPDFILIQRMKDTLNTS